MSKMKNELLQFTLSATSIERAKARGSHLMEALNFAVKQKDRGTSLEEIIEQIDNSFPKITYLDFLDSLNNKLKRGV